MSTELPKAFAHHQIGRAQYGIDSTTEGRDKVDTDSIKRTVAGFIKKLFPNVEADAPGVEEMCMYTVRRNLLKWI